MSSSIGIDRLVTPGFGDTSGIKADEEITKQLDHYFHTSLDFVVESSRSRLTPTQQYIVDSVLALFGRDIKDNIFLLITFSDSDPRIRIRGLLMR